MQGKNLNLLDALVLVLNKLGRSEEAAAPGREAMEIASKLKATSTPVN
jgi:hypothetical protein